MSPRILPHLQITAMKFQTTRYTENKEQEQKLQAQETLKYRDKSLYKSLLKLRHSYLK
jgi:hypothetical protein